MPCDVVSSGHLSPAHEPLGWTGDTKMRTEVRSLVTRDHSAVQSTSETPHYSSPSPPSIIPSHGLLNRVSLILCFVIRVNCVSARALCYWKPTKVPVTVWSRTPITSLSCDEMCRAYYTNTCETYTTLLPCRGKRTK